MSAAREVKARSARRRAIALSADAQPSGMRCGHKEGDMSAAREVKARSARRRAIALSADAQPSGMRCGHKEADA
jgi:hypothetical protein